MEEKERVEKVDYKKYTKDFINLNILNIVVSVMSLMLIFLLIFVPIFKYKHVEETPVKTPQEFENDYDYTLYWLGLTQEERDTGIIVTTEYTPFSMYDEMVYTIKQVTADDSMTGMVSLVFFIFPLLTVLFGVILLVIYGKKVLEQINNFRSIDDYVLISYTEIRKTGTKKEKANFLKKQSIFTMILYIVCDVLFSKIYGKIFGQLMDEIDNKNRIFSYMGNLSGLAGGFYPIVILSIAEIVASGMAKSKSKRISVSIAKEELK